MISSIVLSNFKCFQSLSIDLGNLNVFAGVNGVGKSTVLQSLLVLRQSIRSGNTIDRLSLRGALTDLGSVAEVYCAEPTSDSIGIALKTSDGFSIEIESPLAKVASRERFPQYALTLPQPIALPLVNLLEEPFNYLHAERLGPRKLFQIPADDGHSLSVGKNGEFAPYIVASSHRETRVENPSLILVSSDGKEYPTIRYQWPLWMGRLFPGFDQESEIYGAADQVRLGLALQTQQTGQSLFVRPPNTGFGLSFATGIVVAGLVARSNTVLMVENPEAHLHPKAQSLIGEFLARVAAGGTQVFVETHSEHVLNGMRRVIKQSVLSSESAHMFFFARDPKVLQPDVIPISISASGELSTWPDDFFDQLDKDLSIILS
jgi:predicted ATPase